MPKNSGSPMNKDRQANKLEPERAKESRDKHGSARLLPKGFFGIKFNARPAGTHLECGQLPDLSAVARTATEFVPTK